MVLPKASQAHIKTCMAPIETFLNLNSNRIFLILTNNSLDLSLHLYHPHLQHMVNNNRHFSTTMDPPMTLESLVKFLAKSTTLHLTTSAEWTSPSRDAILHPSLLLWQHSPTMSLMTNSGLMIVGLMLISPVNWRTCPSSHNLFKALNPLLFSMV